MTQQQQTQQQGQQEQQQQQQGGERPALTFESWFGSQDDRVKSLIETHTKGLKSALDSERETRKGLEKQVRELASKAEKGSEAEKQLNELADKMSANDKRVAAYEGLSAAGCSNLKLAYLAAAESGLIDGQGNVNIEKMKTQFPELFKTTQTPPGKAGTGTETKAPGGATMNDFIRHAAGRK